MNLSQSTKSLVARSFCIATLFFCCANVQAGTKSVDSPLNYQWACYIEDRAEPMMVKFDKSEFGYNQDDNALFDKRTGKPLLDIARFDKEALIFYNFRYGSVGLKFNGGTLETGAKAPVKCISSGNLKSKISSGSTLIYGDAAHPMNGYTKLLNGRDAYRALYTSYAYLDPSQEEEMLKWWSDKYARTSDAFVKPELKANLLKELTSLREQAKQNKYYSFSSDFSSIYNIPYDRRMYPINSIDVSTLTYKLRSNYGSELVDNRHNTCLDRWETDAQLFGQARFMFANLSYKDFCSVKIPDIELAKKIEALRNKGVLQIYPNIYAHIVPIGKTGSLVANIIHVEYDFYDLSNNTFNLMARLPSNE
jgi:hypothetical protein